MTQCCKYKFLTFGRRVYSSTRPLEAGKSSNKIIENLLIIFFKTIDNRHKTPRNIILVKIKILKQLKILRNIYIMMYYIQI